VQMNSIRKTEPSKRRIPSRCKKKKSTTTHTQEASYKKGRVGKVHDNFDPFIDNDTDENHQMYWESTGDRLVYYVACNDISKVKRMLYTHSSLIEDDTDDTEDGWPYSPFFRAISTCIDDDLFDMFKLIVGKAATHTVHSIMGRMSCMNETKYFTEILKRIGEFKHDALRHVAMDIISIDYSRVRTNISLMRDNGADISYALCGDNLTDFKFICTCIELGADIDAKLPWGGDDSVMDSLRERVELLSRADRGGWGWVAESPFIDRYLALFSEIDRNRASVKIQRLARRICARNKVDIMRHIPYFLFGKDFGEYRQDMLGVRRDLWVNN